MITKADETIAIAIQCNINESSHLGNDLQWRERRQRLASQEISCLPGDEMANDYAKIAPVME